MTYLLQLYYETVDFYCYAKMYYFGFQINKLILVVKRQHRPSTNLRDSHNTVVEDKSI